MGAAQVSGPVIRFGGGDRVGSLGAPASSGDEVGPFQAAVSRPSADTGPGVLVGPGNGSRAVRLLSSADGSELASGYPFGPSFTGGARLAYVDLTGDGVADPIVGMGIGGGLVRLFDGANLNNFLSGYPFGPAFTGGVFVAAGDINGDGRQDVVVAQGSGGGLVHAYSVPEAELLTSGAPFGPSYTGGVRVAAGDVNGDGRDDLITAQASGGLVSVFDGVNQTQLISGAPYGAGYTGGVFVAAGDVNADNHADVIVSPGTGNGPVIVVDGQTHGVLQTFAAYPAGFTGGVRVAAADLTGDGRADIITAPGAGGLPLLRVFDGATFAVIAEAPAYPGGFSGGVFVAVPPLSGRLRFTSVATTTFTIAEASTFTVATSGAPPATTVNSTGALPAGVTFTDNGDGTASLAGTPAAGTGGSYELTLTATNGTGPDETQIFTLSIVDAMPRVTVTSPAHGAVGVPYDSPLVVTFSEPVHVAPGAFAIECPSGTPVTTTVLTSSPATQFTIEPSADLPPTTACTLRIVAGLVTDADTDDPPDTMESDVVASFTTSACAAITVSPAALVGGNVSLAYGPVTFTQVGGATPTTWSVSSGTLPAGLTLAATTGTLSGTPAAVGASSFTVTATAVSGCTGGVPLTLNIAAGPNQAPSFAVGLDQTVTEDSGAQSVAWATAISPGSVDEAGQTVAFTVTGNTNPALFSVAPALSPTGTLTYTPAANASGTATITLVAQDDGGTALGGIDTSSPQSFTITVSAVNDVPSFTVGLDQTVLENVGPQTIPGWATAISAGPADEAAQLLTFAVSANTAPSLFSAGPEVSSSGELTFTPASNAAGTATITLTLQDNGGTALGGVDTSAGQTFVITLTGVNTAPSFTVGVNQTVAEDSGAQAVPGWATAITAGPADEVGQAATFSVTGNTNPALFSVAPAISPAGALTYTPAVNANGTATITLVLQDDGGIVDGGIDTSAPQNFTITITPVNDAPSFTVGVDQTVFENSGAHTVPGWAAALSAGPADEAGQTLSFTITGNTNPSLFSVAPAVSSTGALTYTLAPGNAGTATISLAIHDSDGTAGGGVDASAPQSFFITVTGVNSAPSFSPGPDLMIDEDSGAQIYNPWATAISPGPADEASQTVTFNVTGNTNPALFSVAPAVSAATGILTFTPAANASGTAAITLTLSDDGGAAGGGVDTSAPLVFNITINEVNDAPSFVATVSPTSLEDAGIQSLPNWASGISAGPASESGQTLTFSVTGNSNPSLFSAAPAVLSTGTLTYASAPNAFGTADITVVLQDSGGVANGGVNTSAPHMFTITVTPVNDPPTLTASTIAYTTVGNTQLHVAGKTLPGLTSATDAGGVLTKAGPSDIDGPAAPAAVPLSDFATPNGTVSVDTDGSFSYLPNANFVGTDTFTVQVTDSVAPANVTVNITVANRVWYVNNEISANNQAGGDGRSTDAFETLAAASTASSANDIIFVFDGDSATTPLAGGIALKSGQKLHGEGVGLTVGALSLVPVGTRPRITSAADTVTVLANTANGDRSGVEIRGFDLTSTGGSAIDVASANTQSLGVRISENTVAGLGTNGIDITQGSTGTATLDVHANTVVAANAGISIAPSAGSTVITAFSDNVVSGNSGAGILISGAVAFDANPGTATLDPVSGGVTLIGAPGNGVSGAGVAVGQMSGALDFIDLDVFADGISAMTVTGTGTFTGLAGARVTVTPSSSTVNGPLLLTGLTADLQLAGLTVASSSTNAVALINVDGTFTAPAGSTVADAASTTFLISGGNATVTYAGTITDDVGQLMSIAGTGGVKTFSGAITDGNDGDGSGISLTGNTGATIVFTGGLTLATGANPAFTATGGGTVTVCDEDPCNPAATGARVNTLTTTTATALNVAGTTIGANHLEFRSISSSGGSAAGIILSNTGTTGGLKIKGTGGVGSGGTIANKTGSDGDLTSGIGISLSNTANVSIDRMQLNDFQNNAIRGLSVTAFRLTNTVINGANGNNSGGSDGAISFGTSNPSGANGLLGTGASASLIDGVNVSGAIEHTIEVYNQTGSFGLTISNSNIHDNSVGSGSDGILIETQGTSTATINIINNDFSNLKSQGIQVTALDGSAADLTITGNELTRGTQGNEGIVLSNATNARLTTLVESNVVSGFGGVGIFVGQGPGTASAASSLHATIRDNTVNSPTLATNHSIIAFLTSEDSPAQAAPARILIDNNTVTQASTTGVARGILVDTPDSGTAPSFYATVTNNKVSILDSVAGVTGIVVQARRGIGRFAVSGNDVDYPNGNPGVNGLRVRQDDPEVGAPGTAQLERGVSASNDPAVVLAANNPAPHTSGTEVLGTVTVVNNGAVLLPTTPPLPLSAGLDGVDADTRLPLEVLSATDLDAVADAARARLAATALTLEQQARLQGLHVAVADVGSGHLSEYADGRIAIDPLAGGRGWFVDQTPLDDEEFPAASGSERQAQPAGAAAGRYDLLTALMHEMHHALGRSDVPVESRADDVMTATLPPGIRRTTLRTR